VVLSPGHRIFRGSRKGTPLRAVADMDQAGCLAHEFRRRIFEMAWAMAEVVRFTSPGVLGPTLDQPQRKNLSRVRLIVFRSHSSAA